MGAAMGFTPREVDDMSLWQYQAVAAGVAEAHRTDDGLDDAEAATLAAALDAALDASAGDD